MLLHAITEMNRPNQIMGRRRTNYSSMSSSSSAASSSSSLDSDLARRAIVKKPSNKPNPSNAYMRHRHQKAAYHAGHQTQSYQVKGTSESGLDWLKKTLYRIHVPALIVISFIVIVIATPIVYPIMTDGNDDTEAAPVYRVAIVLKYPHDIQSFTQGLAYDDDEPGVLYESTGLYGKSGVRRVHLKNGSVLQSAKNDPTDFGEGLTFHGMEKNHIVQVMWKSGQGNVYDRYTLEHLYSFDAFDLKDGWGIAQVPEKPNCFYITDGSPRIRMFELRPNIKKAYVVKELEIKDGEHSVALLNEIEVVDDEIWANILFSELIVKINRYTGRVTGYLDLRQLLHKSDISDPTKKIDVLNGIAYCYEYGMAYVTGKLWPKIIAIHPHPNPYAIHLQEAGIDPFFLQPEKVRYIFEHMLA